MGKRIAAIIFIYFCTAIAWVVLGSTVLIRTYQYDDQLGTAVGELWGTVQQQRAPTVTYQIIQSAIGEEPKLDKTVHPTEVEASTIDVDLDLDHRRKGLLWYSTYRVRFAGTYRIFNDSTDPWKVAFHFTLPAQGQAIYDNFRFAVGGEEIPDIAITSGTLTRELELLPGESETIDVSYQSQGMDEWWYVFGPDVTQVKNFSLTMNTDFDQINFPQNSISPTKKDRISGGWRLKWDYTNLLSSVQIGMEMPGLLNPGPWASRIIFFAPVSLFLFFFLLFLFTTVRKVKVHPMNYFFLGAAFFSYHLLLAYLVDHISIHLAFWISSAVSILLVVTYMRLVVGTRLALVEVGISQLVYLAGFSYTFFFEGYTGLVITIMCVITLFVVMQFTGRLDWEAVFQRRDRRPRDVAQGQAARDWVPGTGDKRPREGRAEGQEGPPE